MHADAKILVVDDELVTRQCLSSYFESEGYTVYCAETAEQAEGILAREAIDLAVEAAEPAEADGIVATHIVRGRSPGGPVGPGARLWGAGRHHRRCRHLRGRRRTS